MNCSGLCLHLNKAESYRNIPRDQRLVRPRVAITGIVFAIVASVATVHGTSVRTAILMSQHQGCRSYPEQNGESLDTESHECEDFAVACERIFAMMADNGVDCHCESQDWRDDYTPFSTTTWRGPSNTLELECLPPTANAPLIPFHQPRWAPA